MTRFSLPISLFIAAFLFGCSPKDGPDSPTLEAIDNTEEVNTYYAAHPDLFTFKTIADLPTNLDWQDGMDMPEIGSDQAKKGGTFYETIADFPRTLRTTGPDSNGSFRGYIMDNTSMGLGARHPDEFDYYPGIAKAWAIDTSKKTVYVKLNPEARWSDGVPITTDDFVFMFFFYLSDYIVSPFANNWFSTRFTNITKYDDLTFAIKVRKVKPDMEAYVLSLRGVPQHFFKELGDDYVDRYQWKFVPTSGPYTVRDKDIVKGRSITLTHIKDWWAKDNKYWKNRFNPDRIQLNVVRDEPKRFEVFKHTDIDQISLSLAEYWYDKLPNDDPDVTNGYIQKDLFYNQRPRPNWGLWMNTSRPLLDNLDVRIGLNYATDWELVIEKFFRGDYTRLQNGQEGFGDFSDSSVRARKYDITRAEEAFAKAGFSKRGPDGILINDQGQRLSFSLSTGYERLKDILTILKEQAAKAGLEYRVEVLDSTSGFKKVQEKKHDVALTAFNIGFQMYPRYWDFYDSSNAWDTAYLPDGSVNPDRKLKTQTNNLEVFADPEMDKMIAAYRASEDRDEMVELSHKMIKFHHDYASFIPGFAQPYYRIARWRWVRYPEGFNNKHSGRADEFWVHWIDTDMKKETLAARKSGKTFPPHVQIFDQWKLTQNTEVPE